MFGPYYPTSLQRSVDHAEKLCQLLALPETVASLDVWNIGRGEEIARFVELVVCDWIDHLMHEDAAAAEIDRYLEGLHEGLRRHLQIRDLPCCPDTVNRLPSVSDVFPTSQVLGGDPLPPSPPMSISGQLFSVDPARGREVETEQAAREAEDPRRAAR